MLLVSHVSYCYYHIRPVEHALNKIPGDIERHVVTYQVERPITPGSYDDIPSVETLRDTR